MLKSVAAVSSGGGGGALTTTQIAGLTATEIGYLSTNAMFGFTSTQIGALTTTSFSGVTSSQLGSLTTTSLAGLTTTQINSLTSTQLAGVSKNLSAIQTLYIPAHGMVSRGTNGPSIGQVELATHKVMVASLDFDAVTEEYAQAMIRMPKGWDAGTVTFVVRWSHAATTTNFGVVWGLQAIALADDDAEDQAFGTAQTVTDTGGTTNDIYETTVSSAITIANTPAKGDFVRFQIFRKVGDAGDTMAIDARLEGVAIFITFDSMSDA